MGVYKIYHPPNRRHELEFSVLRWLHDGHVNHHPMFGVKMISNVHIICIILNGISIYIYKYIY